MFVISFILKIMFLILWWERHFMSLDKYKIFKFYISLVLANITALIQSM